MRDLSIIVAFSRDHSIIVVPNLPSSTIAQIELSMLDAFLRFLHPLRQRIAHLRSANLIFVLIKLFESEYDYFRFSLSFWKIRFYGSEQFWTVLNKKISTSSIQNQQFKVKCKSQKNKN